MIGAKVIGRCPVDNGLVVMPEPSVGRTVKVYCSPRCRLNRSKRGRRILARRLEREVKTG